TPPRSPPIRAAPSAPVTVLRAGQSCVPAASTVAPAAGLPSDPITLTSIAAGRSSRIRSGVGAGATPVLIASPYPFAHTRTRHGAGPRRSTRALPSSPVTAAYGSGSIVVTSTEAPGTG